MMDGLPPVDAPIQKPIPPMPKPQQTQPQQPTRMKDDLAVREKRERIKFLVQQWQLCMLVVLTLLMAIQVAMGLLWESRWHQFRDALNEQHQEVSNRR